MSKTKSQWDFGELFPREQTRASGSGGLSASAQPEPDPPGRKILSVSELTVLVKRLLEQQVGSLWVTGEVTNLRIQSSGHAYFTLKDAAAQLSCVLFRGVAVAHRELLQDGRKLLLQGDVTVYESRGQYQLIVRAVELQGVGALQIAFEQLKRKLQAEGLFATERKRALPKYPQRIGLVTSPTGAAIRDVLHGVRRRNPGLEMILVACRVQGEGAGREIAAAIRLLNEFSGSNASPRHPMSGSDASTKLDLILVTRGGGSLEDLWAFNEEIVARAIFESAVPVVSAVGHEIDFTISDFVADFRAATPSAAAEIITEGAFASREFVAEAAARMDRRIRRQLAEEKAGMAGWIQRLARVHPRRRFGDWLQRLDDWHASLVRGATQGSRRQRTALVNLADRFLRSRPARGLKLRREAVELATSRLRETAQHRVRERKDRLLNLVARLQLLGPEQVLDRGYSITIDAASGKVLRDAGQVKSGQRLKTRLAKGEVFSRTESGTK